MCTKRLHVFSKTSKLVGAVSLYADISYRIYLPIATLILAVFLPKMSVFLCENTAREQNCDHCSACHNQQRCVRHSRLQTLARVSGILKKEYKRWESAWHEVLSMQFYRESRKVLRVPVWFKARHRLRNVTQLQVSNIA